MEEGKKPVEKSFFAKRPGKDQCIIIILVGVLLCVIALPVRQKNSESGLSNSINGTINQNSVKESGGTMQRTAEADMPDSGEDGYAGYWEAKLEDALKYVDGAGRVKVLITLSESEHKIVEKDGPETRSDISETDSAGGNRTTGESRTEKSTIYTVDDRGQSVPYVVMTIPPVVEGVVVIAQGAQKQSVRENIIEAIQVLFDIDANKIKIVKMKNNQ